MLLGSVANAVGCLIILKAGNDIDGLPKYNKATSIIFMIYNFC